MIVIHEFLRRLEGRSVEGSRRTSLNATKLECKKRLLADWLLPCKRDARYPPGGRMMEDAEAVPRRL